MTLANEVKATLITAAITEDRTELRLIKDRIYSATTLITTASFGVTAFLLGKDSSRIMATSFQLKLMSVAIDIGLLLILWVLFLRLLKDLKTGQLCLETRERLLDGLVRGEPPKEPFEIYEMELTEPLGITHNGLFFVVGSASAAIAIKLSALSIVNF